MARCTAAALTVALAGGLSACDTAPDPNNPLAQLSAAANQMQKAAESFSGMSSKPVPPVAFRDLIGFLPTSIDGMKAEPPKGETTTAGGWKYSQAEVNFRSANGQRSAEIGIFDYAHIPLLYVPFRALLNMKLSHESTEGWERSGQIAGFPAYEKWNQDGSSEVVVLVADRFIVKADTRGMGEGSARKIAERMKLKALASRGG